MIKLTFLGTGTSQGVPMIGCTCPVCRSTDKHDKRLRSSVMMEYYGGEIGSDPDCRIIIDAGPDFRYQMLRKDIRAIDAIVLTHEHKDHIGGIDDVRGFNYFQGKAIPIYATRRVAKVVKKDFDYAFSESKYPGAPDIDLRLIDADSPFEVDGVEITPIQGFHYKLPVLGYRMGNVAYLTDFNSIPEPELAKLEGLDILVVNALRHEQHLSHYNVSQATALCRQVGPRKAYFTHMSHQIGLYEDIKDDLPDGIEYAYDGLEVCSLN